MVVKDTLPRPRSTNSLYSHSHHQRPDTPIVLLRLRCACLLARNIRLTDYCFVGINHFFTFLLFHLVNHIISYPMKTSAAALALAVVIFTPSALGHPGEVHVRASRQELQRRQVGFSIHSKLTTCLIDIQLCSSPPTPGMLSHVTVPQQSMLSTPSVGRPALSKLQNVPTMETSTMTAIHPVENLGTSLRASTHLAVLVRQARLRASLFPPHQAPQRLITLLSKTCRSIFAPGTFARCTYYPLSRYRQLVSRLQK